MSGFTPGPWRAESAVNANWIEAGHASQPVTIARTFYKDVGAEVEDANAKLIAAAPELLAALEAICAEAAGMTMTMRRRMIFNDGLAALFKARGEPA